MMARFEFVEVKIDEANNLSMDDWVFLAVEHGVYYFKKRQKGVKK